MMSQIVSVTRRDLQTRQQARRKLHLRVPCQGLGQAFGKAIGLVLEEAFAEVLGIVHQISRISLQVLAMACLFFGAGVYADERVPNFTLIDQHGRATELHYHDDASAVVLMAHKTGSASVNASAKALAHLQQANPGVRFFLINAEPSDTREQVSEDLESLGLGELTVLDDASQLVSRTLDFDYAGEALVIDTQRWEVLYRGPVAEQPGESENLIETVLVQHKAGEPISVASHGMPSAFAGEQIAYDDAMTGDHQHISYAETIAPLLIDKCADCHRPEGIGPWAMTSHAMVQGFSPMIRETILTKRMPPWHADPQVGEFNHDISLSIAEQRALVNWIDAGAQRGSGPDPLTSVTAQESAWSLGEPDLIVELPAFDLPATGVIDYQNFIVDNPLDEAVWVKAVQVIPGDPKAVHHAIATVGEASAGSVDEDEEDALFRPQLMTFVPGNDTYIYPEGNGLYIRPDMAFFTQMHYTTYGRETRDQTRIGIYFADEEPEHVLQHYSIVNPTISIPPGDAAHEEVAYVQLQRDAMIYALFPHAHYRGKSSSFTLRYPDGKEELVLNVPNYDFNWQRYFQFAEPKEVPAGTMIIHRTVYDNSANNESNPDATHTVDWGEQSWEEMLYGGVSFRYMERQEGDTDVDTLSYLTHIAMGFLDRNVDGILALNEMPRDSREQLAFPFVMLDKEKKGGLNYQQFRTLMAQDEMGGAIMSQL